MAEESSGARSVTMAKEWLSPRLNSPLRHLETSRSRRMTIQERLIIMSWQPLVLDSEFPLVSSLREQWTVSFQLWVNQEKRRFLKPRVEPKSVCTSNASWWKNKMRCKWMRITRSRSRRELRRANLSTVLKTESCLERRLTWMRPGSNRPNRLKTLQRLTKSNLILITRGKK